VSLPEAQERYASEIRAWLLGRLGRPQKTRVAPSQRSTSLRYPPILAWWIFEGKRFDGVDGPLHGNLKQIDRQAQRLLSSYNPSWRKSDSPEGETDWLESFFSSLTTGRPVYVSRATRVGLGDLEREALLGWLEWLRNLWVGYVARVGVADESEPEVPWPERPNRLDIHDERVLRRWAHNAKRSRWPLLRNVVAESLRAALEPQVLERLPLPSDLATLFEMYCMVRILQHVDPCPRQVRWLDLEFGSNTVQVPGLTYAFQYSLPRELVLSTKEFDDGLREAMVRQGERVHSRIDGWLEFQREDVPWGGILIEAKSGSQEASAAIYQLKCYRAALSQSSPRPILVLGITEKPADAEGLERAIQKLRMESQKPQSDFWVFCSPGDLHRILDVACIGPHSGATNNDLMGTTLRDNALLQSMTQIV